MESWRSVQDTYGPVSENKNKKEWQTGIRTFFQNIPKAVEWKEIPCRGMKS